MQNLSSEALNKYSYKLPKKFTGLASGDISRDIYDKILPGSAYLILDGTEVDEVDIAGINLLIQIFKTIRQQNGTMNILLKRNECLASMLHLTKYDKWFQLIYK
jgi:anti-anti-sigma regulatory factor